MEYDESDAEARDHFIQIADQIEDRFPHVMVTGNAEGTEPRSGSFEVSFGAHQLFSRLTTHRLPSADELVDPLESLVVEEGE